MPSTPLSNGRTTSARVASRRAVATSHSLTVLSLLPVASILPSGLKLTEPVTPSENPPSARTTGGFVSTVFVCFQVRTSHSDMGPIPAQAKILPSGENATLRVPRIPVRTRTSLRVVASQILTSSLSSLAETRSFPSGEKATHDTSPLWSDNVANSFPLAGSHSLTNLSKPPDAKVLPSGATAIHRTSLA